jgi:hypothetical protein
LSANRFHPDCYGYYDRLAGTKVEISPGDSARVTVRAGQPIGLVIEGRAEWWCVSAKANEASVDLPRSARGTYTIRALRGSQRRQPAGTLMISGK